MNAKAAERTHEYVDGSISMNMKGDSLESRSSELEATCEGRSPHNCYRNHDAAANSKPRISSPSGQRAQKLIASASASGSGEYLPLQGEGKESISSDADSDSAGVVFRNADKDEADGCLEANDEDGKDNNNRGLPPSNCDGSDTNYKYKFSLRECGFPDMVEDISATTSNDIQNLKLRLLWQEQERMQG
jgi:hypothetical protein